MPTNYPASLDTTTELPAAAGVGANLSTFPHSTMHGNAHDAIRAIEAELGVAPSDTFSTVKARLDQIPLGIWATYTPTLTQGVAVTKTVGYAGYQRVGRCIIGAFHITATSTGTTSSIILIGLPVAAAALPDDIVMGSGVLFRATNYYGPLAQRTSTSVGIVQGPGYLGSSVAVTVAVGDKFSGQFCYQAAS